VADLLSEIAKSTISPEAAARALEELQHISSACAATLRGSDEFFLRNLANLLILSPPMQDALRAHPDWLLWLRNRVAGLLQCSSPPNYEKAWEGWLSGGQTPANVMEGIRALKRREYLEISYLDLSGIASFEQIVARLSALADWVISKVLLCCWRSLNGRATSSLEWADGPEDFAVVAMGKLGGAELNYSSDVDLIFCRRSSDRLHLATCLGERLVQELSRPGPEGFLYRVDMRLRPYGETGPLVPTLSNLANYFESWGEAWERQALIKARPVAGGEDLCRRFSEFVRDFVFARQMDDSSLEEIKRVKYRSEREHAADTGRLNIKQGSGGIRDIEFYVQYLQLIAGWQHPAARAGSTLQALHGLAEAKMLLEGELSQLSLAYVLLRTVEHRLQLRSLVAECRIPDQPEELRLLAQGLGFDDATGGAGRGFERVLGNYRASVRRNLERIYLTPGYLRVREHEEEFAQLLTDRTPRGRVRQILSHYGFQDIDKAWQNLRLMALGPAGHMLPPGERRAFLEIVVPILEVLRDSVDPDQALHHLESFAAATGNRVSFLRTLASRRPHLARLSNLLALSNRCHQILVRHPEYFDSLARGVHIHEGRSCQEMYAELLDRVESSPQREENGLVLRRFRQREMIRVAYRDLAGLADPLEVSRELSELAEACVRVAADLTHSRSEGREGHNHDLLWILGLGKFGSRQMHYGSDLDLILLYDAPPAAESAEMRANAQLSYDNRGEEILRVLSAVTSEGVAYSVDLRLRPEGSSGLLARSWESFLAYSRGYMQPWERMALVRSRMLEKPGLGAGRWDDVVEQVVWRYPWEEEAFEQIRRLKRRIETEKSKESAVCVDFKYGKGGITDLEFLIQFLQIAYGNRHPGVRAPGLAQAACALKETGARTPGCRFP